MIKAERQNLILEYVAKDKKVLLDQLSEILKVSEDTVRRDIKELSDQGLLRAVRGGAMHRSPIPMHYRDRQNVDVEHKKIIAAKALEFIKPNMVLLVDSGTSTLAAVANLPKDMQLTVVTNSFPVASVLEDHPKIEVLFIGGRLNKTSFSTTGYETIQTLRSIRADICFLGVCSIDLNYGVTGVDYEDSQIKKAMVETSKYIVALSTCDKLNTSESFYICAANLLNVIVTEADPKLVNLSDYSNAGIEIR
jgi:DeoR/GlpR family transcriptional regulator of sugar metabolism